MPLATARIADYPLVRVGAALPLADPSNLSGSVAQGIERPPPKRQVDGSNPSGVTTRRSNTVAVLTPKPGCLRCLVGYAGWAVNRRRCPIGREWSLWPDFCWRVLLSKDRNQTATGPRLEHESKACPGFTATGDCTSISRKTDPPDAEPWVTASLCQASASQRGSGGKAAVVRPWWGGHILTINMILYFVYQITFVLLSVMVWRPSRQIDRGERI